MTSIIQRGQRATRPTGRRFAALVIVLLAIAPLLGLIFAAVYFGMRRRRSATALSAADVTAAPTRARSVEPAPNRTRAVLAALAPTSGNLLGGAAVIAVVVALAVTAAAGSYAYLNAQRTVGTAVTLTAGSLGVTVNGSTSSTAVALPSGFSNLLPGDYFNQAITVGNPGSTPGNISAAIDAVNAAYEVRVTAAACPSTGYTTTVLSASTLSTTALALGQLAGGASATGCLQIGLVAGAATTTNITSAVTATASSFSPTITFTATQPSS